MIMNDFDVSKMGLVRGMIVNVDDPLKLCRVQVRIPAIHGIEGMSNYRVDADLPWAFPSLPANMKQVPKVKDFVWVMFESNRVDMPVYMGVVLGTNTSNPDKPIIYGTSGKTSKEPPVTVAPYEAPYEGSKAGTIFESPNGFSFAYNDGDLPDGADGQMTLKKDNMEETKGKDLNQVVVGDSTIKATSTGVEVSHKNGIISIDGSQLSLSFGGSSIILTSSGIALSIGSTTINLTASSLNLSSPVIHENT